jgi:hypothetical protein
VTIHSPSELKFVSKTGPPWPRKTVDVPLVRITATAWDTAGNHSSTSQIINIHNRKTWLQG